MMPKKQKKRAFDELYAPLEKFKFSKPAFDIVADYSYLQELGKRILQQNMRYCKEKVGLLSYDPDNPYDDYDCKNMYFSAANDLCQYSLWQHGLYDFSEKYYQTMLLTIKQFEKDNTYNHNKGMVYANLGIAQAVQGRIDEGFANILKALDEDRGYLQKGKNPAQEIFDSRLFTQLEKTIVLDSLEKRLASLRSEEATCPSAKDFLKSLSDPDQRIFFEYTYAKIMDNHEVWKEKPNRFSANRMLAYLQDMCLFAEDLIKKKGYSGMLNSLISSAFSGIDLAGCGADSYRDLNDKLEKMYAETNKRDKALRMLLTLRNFSSHNISSGEKNDFFFRDFDKVFNEILRAIMHIFSVPKVT
jgi:hypothetical protein